jgi:quinol monooxygenase YgiN
LQRKRGLRNGSIDCGSAEEDRPKERLKDENGTGVKMMITVNLYYRGSNGNARAFAEEMEASGIAHSIRKEPGNLRYQYFQPLDDPETVLLIDSWKDQAAIDAHHASPMMAQLAVLREKYDLHMTVERFVSEDVGTDEKFIRK